MSISVRQSPFEPWEELRRHEQAAGGGGSYGATAAFVGTMRELNEGGQVRRMFLEHYPGMTEKYLRQIAARAREQWDLVDLLIIHRVGELAPAEPIVLIAVWSAHRAEAFEACRFLIEELKSRAPFWKKEYLDSQTRWVEHNTPGGSKE